MRRPTAFKNHLDSCSKSGHACPRNAVVKLKYHNSIANSLDFQISKPDSKWFDILTGVQIVTSK
jgi:hypothetical protein